MANKEAIKKERELSQEINNTSVSKLSELLDTNLTIEIIINNFKNKYFGNGKFAIKCINRDEQLVQITFKDKKRRIYRVIDK